MGVGQGVFEASISILGFGDVVTNFASGLFDQLTSRITSNKALISYAKETVEEERVKFLLWDIIVPVHFLYNVIRCKQGKHPAYCIISHLKTADREWTE